MSQDKIQADFDRIACLVAEEPERADRYERFLLAQVPASCQRVLEVGCGAGRLARAIAARGRRGCGDRSAGTAVLRKLAGRSRADRASGPHPTSDARKLSATDARGPSPSPSRGSTGRPGGILHRQGRCARSTVRVGACTGFRGRGYLDGRRGGSALGPWHGNRAAGMRDRQRAGWKCGVTKNGCALRSEILPAKQQPGKTAHMPAL